MFLNRKELLNMLLRHKLFNLIISRFIRNTQNVLSENKLPCEESDDKPKKGKISILKKRFVSSRNASVIEWKAASDVMKNLNFEYKHLYGPIQSNTDLKDMIKDRVIQHDTIIPIIEPSADHNSPLVDGKLNANLDSILEFPLVNKCTFPDNKINEFNILRKNLESFCKDSKLPSVSLILQSTMPKERREILDRWRQSMIEQMGEEGFERYQSELFEKGASLHHIISDYLIKTPVSELQIKKENIGHWNSLKHVFPKISNVKLIEEAVMHPFLCYKGIVDCFAEYKDHLVVIDWKSSKKLKKDIKSTYDDPLQIAAYVGALNFDPKYQYLASKGLIVVAYENGAPGTVHYLDETSMQNYWSEWLQRVKQFWEMKISKSEAL